MCMTLFTFEMKIISSLKGNKENDFLYRNGLGKIQFSGFEIGKESKLFTIRQKWVIYKLKYLPPELLFDKCRSLSPKVLRIKNSSLYILCALALSTQDTEVTGYWEWSQRQECFIKNVNNVSHVIQEILNSSPKFQNLIVEPKMQRYLDASMRQTSMNLLNRGVWFCYNFLYLAKQIVLTHILDFQKSKRCHLLCSREWGYGFSWCF